MRREVEMRILLADDHPIVRRGLRGLLDHADLPVAAEAEDGLSAISLCQDIHPDIVILDIAIPKLNGIDVTSRLKQLDSPPAVIILTMYLDESYITRAIEAGANAYLLKSAADEDLVPATHAVGDGKLFFSPAVIDLLIEGYVHRLQNQGLSDSYHLLTSREKEVLQLLAEGRSNKEVAAEIAVELSTVQTHRANLMQKLSLHNTAEIVLYAVRKGMIA
jgi:DNA-binding NarL/FixJ family response regulator